MLRKREKKVIIFCGIIIMTIDRKLKLRRRKNRIRKKGTAVACCWSVSDFAVAAVVVLNQI